MNRLDSGLLAAGRLRWIPSFLTRAQSVDVTWGFSRGTAIPHLMKSARADTSNLVTMMLPNRGKWSTINGISAGSKEE